ncbi:site-specific integrase [Halomonas sp. Bachu 37]|uniref:tyrosine-type recombinase/integrase n=1 Tax=Halomonas kashgarensis TaxID=3084920 RepID=UPI003217D913
MHDALLLRQETVTGCRISATSDIEAVGQWLQEYQASERTQRAYRREAERLLLWLGVQGVSLAQMDRQYLAEFDAFLADPQPRCDWIGPTRPRQDPNWKPFRGPLSAASRRQTLVILQGLFAWLVEAGWVSHNPFRLMRDKRRRLNNQHHTVERYLESELWQWFWAWLNQPPAQAATAREHYEHERRIVIFAFAYLLAPRISEMASASMGDFKRREGRWWWEVIGKGGKHARIPLPEDMLYYLGQWRMTLGLEKLPEGDEADQASPVIRALDGKRGIGDNQLYRLIRHTFARAADDLEAQGGDPGHVLALRQATPHWLRHTSITHQAQAGVELRYLAESARHSRLDTTSQYLHTEAEHWHLQQQRHRLPV